MGERCPAIRRNTIYMVVKALKTYHKCAKCAKLLNAKYMYVWKRKKLSRSELVSKISFVGGVLIREGGSGKFSKNSL